MGQYVVIGVNCGNSRRSLSLGIALGCAHARVSEAKIGGHLEKSPRVRQKTTLGTLSLRETRVINRNLLRRRSIKRKRLTERAARAAAKIENFPGASHPSASTRNAHGHQEIGEEIQGVQEEGQNGQRQEKSP